MSLTSGIYRIGGASGTVGAGISGGSNIYSFRWGSPSPSGLLCAVRKVRFAAGDTSTAFAAGVFTFNMFVARAFTASDTGGTALTPAGNDGKLRTGFPKSQVADIRISNTAALGAGTRTLDAQAIATITQSDPATAGNNILLPVDLFSALDVGISEQPLVLAQNEGFVIQATVPATGTWTFSVETLYEEGTGF